MKISISEYEAFLDSWPNPKKQLFIRDGIFDVDRWKKAKTKVLFLLKEAYSKDGKFSDVRKIVEKPKAKDQTWSRLSNWAYFAQNYQSNTSNLSNEKEDRQQRYESLKSCALINIKKSGGNTKSDQKEIKQIALRDSQYLMKQIDIIDPQIVICGNTWKAIEQAIKKENKSIEKKYDYVRIVENRIYVHFVHPAIQSTKLIDYALPFLLRQALSK